MTITVDFENSPTIGKEYKLLGIIGETEGETAKGTLVQLEYRSETAVLSNDRKEVYTELFAVFEKEDGANFERIVLPPLEN